MAIERRAGLLLVAKIDALVNEPGVFHGWVAAERESASC